MNHRWFFVLHLLAAFGPACCAALLRLRAEAGSEANPTDHSQCLRQLNGMAWSDFLHPAAHSVGPLPWVDEDPALSMSRAMDILRDDGMAF